MSTERGQRGYLIPLAIFILVGLGALALSISRLATQGAVGSAQQAVTAQALYAADSGAQYAMHQLFYVAAGGSSLSRALVTSNCSATNGDTLSLSTAGLAGCSVTISCSTSIDSGDTTSFFTVNSSASCGSGGVTAQRAIEVRSRWRN